VREQKRAQFEQPRSRTGLHLALAGVALAAVAVIALVVVLDRGHGGPAAQAVPVAASGADVTIPVSQVSDGQAHYFTYASGGTEVQYFVMEAPNGKVKVALDACQVCYPEKKGYHQEGGVMVCNNCGRRFEANQIDVERGGCNPIPVAFKVRDGSLVLPTSELQSGVQYF
jgi:uncharacterized membrane protein